MVNLDQKDIARILQNYTAGTLQTAKKVATGYVNHNWILRTTTGKYILRLSAADRTRAEMRYEHAFLRRLRKQFPYEIPVPLPTKTGKTTCTYKKRLLWLYPYIEGTPGKKATVPIVKQVARMMALMHLQAERMRIPPDKKRPAFFKRKRFLLKLSSLERTLQKRKEPVFRYYCTHVEEMKNAIRSLHMEEYDKLKQFPIHADIYQPNLLFAKDKLVGVIDFDNVRENTAIRDINCYLYSSCNKGSRLDIDKARQFLVTYRNNRRLDTVETKFISDITIAESVIGFWYYTYILYKEPKRKVTLSMVKLARDTAVWYAKNRAKLQRELT